MDPAKLQLREDIKNGLHNEMTPKELWNLRPELYKKFKLDKFRPRIYQEIRGNKCLNYLEKKRTEKRDAFAETRNQK